MVTHDMLEALTMADRVAVMLRGELRQVATPSELMTAPKDEYVAELVATARRQGEELSALAGTA
jgi:ABC-type proline/glycine betaine transport system ATPase subunit